MSEKQETNHKYEKLPFKEAEAISLDRLLVDNIGPYTLFIDVHDDSLLIKSLTTEKPQSNSIFEIIYRVIVNLVLTFDLKIII